MVQFRKKRKKVLSFFIEELCNFLNSKHEFLIEKSVKELAKFFCTDLFWIENDLPFPTLIDSRADGSVCLTWRNKNGIAFNMIKRNIKEALDLRSM